MDSLTKIPTHRWYLQFIAYYLKEDVIVAVAA